VPALVAAASVAMVLAVLAGYVRSAAVDSGQFANRATAALRDPSVRSLIAQRVTDQLVLRKAGDLIAARPLIESAVSAAAGSRAFTGIFRRGVRDVHRAVFERDQNTLTLTVSDIGTVVGGGLQVVRPSLARKIERTSRVEIIKRDIGAVSARAIRAAHAVRVLAVLLLLVAVIAAGGAVALALDRRRTVVQLGIGAAVGGIFLVVALGVSRSAAIGHVHGPEARAAVGAVWDAFLDDLRVEAWILAGSGAVVAAAAASLIRPIDIAGPLRGVARGAMREPARPALRVLRAGALVLAGLLVLLDGDAILRLLIALVGLYLIYAGVSAMLWVVYKPRPAREAPRGRRRALTAALLAAAVIIAAVAVFAGAGGATTAAPAAGPCNGSIALCGRTLDQVALPATHNSMAVPLPGWFAAEQDRPIPDQLQDGIRGLLIDTYYAERLRNGRLRTEIGDTHTIRSAAQADGVSSSTIDAALRIRNRLGFAGKGTRGMYLCHSFCEIGGTSLGSVLHELHAFLIANPGEVVVIVNQDYVTPQDFVGAVRKAGLEELAYKGPTTAGSWPTLREMIDTNQRVVFLAENRAGAAPWYHPAYQAITEETPYHFAKVGQLTDPALTAASCRPNRGPQRAPLFLVNHWVTTPPLPLPSNAAKINAYGPLLHRLRECQRLRRHLPNLVAVNFYRRGDLFRVVDALNGTK
jgi:hypothetical protein